MAFYDLVEGKQGYHLSISFDRDVILAELQVQYPHLINDNNQQETYDCLAEYILANLSFQFDKQGVQFSNWYFGEDEQFTRIDFDLLTQARQAKEIKVSNSCLISDDDHNNIIRADLYDRQRSFRMTAKRQKTVISY